MTTRRDVAEFAGVSQSTVSRVINKNGYVADNVREKVLKAVEELNYIPNRAARSLRLQRYKQIACITQSIRSPFYNEIIEGIEETAASNGYTFSLYKADYKNIEPIRALLEGPNDGVIMLSPGQVRKTINLEDISSRLPTVLYKDYEESSSISCVSIDLRKAMKCAVEHLIENGHKKIAFLGYQNITSVKNPSKQVEDPRYLGYLDAMQENSLPVLPNYFQIIGLNNDTLTMGYKKISLFTNEKADFTAIAAANDLLAIGAMRALRESGRRIPEDVSIVGIDDIELASIITPSLTTIQIPKQKIGNLLMHLLIEKMNGKEKNKSLVDCETELVVRESVKALTSQPTS